jgi:Flp pilus assembly protein TadG
MRALYMHGRSCLSLLRADRRGGAAIEFAVVAPVLFTILLGALDVGRMFYVGQELQYATQQAARYYSLNSTSATSAITQYLQNLMPVGMGNGVSVAYSPQSNCNSNSFVTCTTMTATYSFRFVAGYLGLGTRTITATSQAVLY